MNSILQDDKEKCFLCGRCDEPLDKHHIFFGALRSKSEKYGLTVYLCHNRCHIFGSGAVHVNRENDLRIKKLAQLKAMETNGWSIDDFRKEFYKNYLEVEK